MAKCRPIYRGGLLHRTDMSVVVPITLSCRPRVLPGYKVTRNTSTTDIGAGTDTDFIGACTPGLRLTTKPRKIVPKAQGNEAGPLPRQRHEAIRKDLWLRTWKELELLTG